MTGRATGPDPATRAAVYERDGYRCIRCEGDRVLQVHHRRPRAMGGTRRAETNGLANLVLLCEDCHADVETNRTSAYADGLLVHSWQVPADVPVLWRGARVLLFDAGGAVAA